MIENDATVKELVGHIYHGIKHPARIASEVKDNSRRPTFESIAENGAYLLVGAQREVDELDMGDVARQHLKVNGVDVDLFPGYLYLYRFSFSLVQNEESYRCAFWPSDFQHCLGEGHP
ncbi:hypothetical protein ES703_109644 [subsurface metagenome]